ncbi:MAG: type II toxin-antitoxin system prevent-host-death family antitoxin [Deltaproteobacteria bacterium]|nr:type II toxin-antitoxin system prevent-host-death family antitoxin [Deltaproteobacteria bacterium]
MKKRYYTIHEAKTSLSKLIQRALRGEEVVIAKRNVPLVKLTTLAAEKVRLGRFKGQVEIAKDFDETPSDFVDYTKGS